MSLINPHPMAENGFYNANSSLQSHSVKSILHHLEYLIKIIDVSSEQVSIADYGCSQGLNSIEPIRLAIKLIAEKEKNVKSINLIHIDLPENDFTTLFKTLNDNLYSDHLKNINLYSMAIGRSYYNNVLPPCSVNLAWNAWTMHWLSQMHKLNPKDKSTIYIDTMEKLVDDQLDQDWRNFLTKRSLELRPSGGLISLFGARLHGRYGLHEIRLFIREIFDELISSNIMNAVDQDRFVRPTAQRTAEQIRAPFNNSGVYSGLEPIYIDVLPVDDVFWMEFQKHCDPNKFGEQWSNSTRALLEPTLMYVFRNNKNYSSIINEIFYRLSLKIAKNPKPHIHFMGVAILRKLPNM